MFYKDFKLSVVCGLLCVICFTGCIPIFIGAGVVTGYLAIRDSVSGNVEASFGNLWNTSLAVIGKRAEITDQNKQAGLIKAKSGNNDITVKIKELTENSYNLRVSCRKAFALANLGLAQDLFTRIIQGLKKSK